MIGHRYVTYNHAMITTTKPAGVATGTNIKTMLQISNPATRKIWVLEWGFELETFPTALSTVELLDTNVAATTGTAHVAAGLQPIDPGLPPSLMTLGAGATGYNFTAEGATTDSRSHDEVMLRANTTEPQTPYIKKFLPHEMPCIAVSRFLRVRVHFGSSCNIICWVKWGE